MDETCPTEKGIATCSSIGMLQYRNFLDETCPTEKGIATILHMKYLGQNASMMKMKPALQKKGLRLCTI